MPGPQLKMLELFDAGVVEVDPRNALEEIVFFFARRKDHGLRLIADARAANLHFVEPAYAELASPEALAAIEYDGPDMIGFCSGDVEVCFYQYELPEWARRCFTLPAIKAQYLPAALRGRLGLARDAPELKCRFRVAPMGWSWAAHLTQQGHLHVMGRALQSGRWVLDQRAGIDLRRDDAKALYIDNFAVASVDQVRAEGAAQVTRGALAELGVVSTIEACDGSKAELLGCELDRTTGRWRIKPKRFWQLMGALDYLLEAKGRKVTGHEVECVLGRIVAACMPGRGSLALLSACYASAETSGLKRQPLWPSARREQFWARSLLPCIVGEMGKAWSSTVTAYDASPWGYGVVETEWGPAAAEVAQAPGAALILTGRASEFPGISARALTEATWRVVGRGRWRRREATHCLEAASVCWAARRMAKHARRHGRRHLVLGDNMSVTFALAEGRASDHRLLLACRVVFAGSVATDIRLRCRRLPSEWNPSDQASRRRRPPGLKHERGRGPHAEGGADGSVIDPAVHLEFRLRPSRRERQSTPLGAPSDPKLGQRSKGAHLGAPGLWSAAAGLAAQARLKTQAIYVGAQKALLAWLRLRCLPAGLLRLPSESGPPCSGEILALFWGPCAPPSIPVLQQALKGWVQRRPEFPRPPLPWPVAAAAARELLDLNMGMAALGIMIMFETYVRPSELLALLTDHVVLPIPGEAGAARWLAFVIRAQEALAPSKTNAFDIGAPLDLERQCWLARCVEGTLYSLRHGGASHDRIMGARSLAAAQQRGGWRAFRSALRYEKGLELQKLGPARLALLRRRSAGIELAFERYFGLRWGRRA
ncbi:unnamed protein product, partial [Prorocentrum cordatum]